MNRARLSMTMFAILSSIGVGLAHGQAAPSAMKQTLLNASGFEVSWDCNGQKGKSRLTFTEEGARIAVDINNDSRPGCKSEAKLSDTGFSMDGCRDKGMTLTYAADDKKTPFKGKGERCTYEFSPR